VRLTLWLEREMRRRYGTQERAIGIEVYPDDGSDAETLIRCADTAMYDAKKRGRDNHRLFERDMHARAVERQSIEAGLPRTCDAAPGCEPEQDVCAVVDRHGRPRLRRSAWRPGTPTATSSDVRVCEVFVAGRPSSTLPRSASFVDLPTGLVRSWEDHVPYRLSVRRFGGLVAVVVACCGLDALAPRVTTDASTPVPDGERIVAGLSATSARDVRLVAAFATRKTFTIVHDGRTSARVVTDLTFTAPDVKVFTVLESRGSDFMRTRIINRMMSAEVEMARARSRARSAITSDNYRFGTVHDDGDAFVVEVEPRRKDELLFKGRAWITKDGSHLKRIEGEPAKNPSFWTKRIRFVSEFMPVNGVWMQVRTVGTATMRLRGEYTVQSECGPYVMALAPGAAGK
jgi:hypothetical protein